jgi:transcriptional regulator with XRE-family HTH domain
MGKTGSGFFGERLAQHRAAKGLTPYRVATDAKIDRSIYSQIERGKRPPSRANLEALAAVAELGISLDELQAWADLDQIGVDGLARIATYLGDVSVSQEAHPAGSPSVQNHGNHDGIMVSGFVASRKPASNHGFGAKGGEKSATAEGMYGPVGHIDLSGPTVSLPVFGPRAHGGSLSEGLVGATDTLVISALLAAGADAAILVAPDSLPGLGAGPEGMVDYLLVRWQKHQRPVNRYPVVMRQGDQYVYRTYVEDELGVYLEEHQPHATPRRHRYDPTDLVGVVVARYQHWPLPGELPQEAPAKVTTSAAKDTSSRRKHTTPPAKHTSSPSESQERGAEPQELRATPDPTGGQRPLTAKEAALVRQLQAQHPLEDLDLGPGSYVWALPAGERLAALRGALEDLGDGASRDQHGRA